MVYWDFFLIIWSLLVSELYIRDLVLQINATKQNVREEAAYLRKKEGSLPILCQDLDSLAFCKIRRSEKTTKWWISVLWWFCLLGFFNPNMSLQARWHLTFPHWSTNPQVRPCVSLSKSIRKDFSKVIGHGKKKGTPGTKSNLKRFGRVKAKRREVYQTSLTST